MPFSKWTYQWPPLCLNHLFQTVIKMSVAHHKMSVFFIAATLIAEMLFKQFLICTAV